LISSQQEVEFKSNSTLQNWPCKVRFAPIYKLLKDPSPVDVGSSI